jgi:hypothetical protein
MRGSNRDHQCLNTVRTAERHLRSYLLYLEYPLVTASRTCMSNKRILDGLTRCLFNLLVNLLIELVTDGNHRQTAYTSATWGIGVDRLNLDLNLHQRIWGKRRERVQGAQSIVQCSLKLRLSVFHSSLRFPRAQSIRDKRRSSLLFCSSLLFSPTTRQSFNNFKIIILTFPQ